MNEEQKQELKKKVLELINNYHFETDIDKLLASGCINEIIIEEGSYLLPKLIVCAIARQVEFSYSPLSDKKRYKKEIESMYIIL